MKRRLLPLSIKNPMRTELPALMALEAIGEPWFSEAHRCDLLAIGLVAKHLAPVENPIHSVACELVRLLEAQELDADALSALVFDVNAWVQLQPNVRVQAAIDTLLSGPGK